MVSIVIVSFNTKNLLERCIESIYAQLRNNDTEIIVVDNASTDGSKKLVESRFKRVKVVQNKKNEGFSKANNKGVKHAKGEFILFLNSDIQLTTNGIYDAVKKFQEDETIGIIGGVLKNLDGSYQKSHGSFPNLLSAFNLLFLGEKFERKNIVKKSLNCDWVSGGYMLIRSNLFTKTGGFDENIFMYVEDMELCYRIKKMGYKIIIFPSMMAFHKGQGSSNRQFAILQIYKGLLYYYKKHKSHVEYTTLTYLLRIKAILAIIVGMIKKDIYLKDTYSQALKTIQ